MFFLLASFMMISLQMSRTANIKVNLPTATQAQQDYKPDMINIAVDKSGAVWLEKKQISLPNLGLVLSNRFRADTNLPVYISGDRDTLHGDMVNVYQTVRAAGIQKVAFMTDANHKFNSAMKIRTPIPEKKSRLEIIPLIDIMFFLLASFMMISLQMQIVRTRQGKSADGHARDFQHQAGHRESAREPRRPGFRGQKADFVSRT